MKVIILLIIASLTVAIGFLIAFFWSVKTGQFDDDTSPAVRILMDNEITSNEKSKINHYDN
ncbi:MAG: cbb3-type cytochrome oxidase assembly protein CcoS [Bacteroidota bacterium]|jgi:cbb3-type cytochrome oxidase maturation protein